MNLFQNLDECQQYIDFLTAQGRTIPQNVLDEKARLEAEENINEEEFIFSTMAAHNKFMTPEKEKVVREMADQLLMDGEDAKQPCLLLGKVQCGKTDTFLSIMGLCFDRGIDIAVVMTKGTNTLTKQTIQRLSNDFRFFKDQHKWDQKVIVSVWDVLDLYKRGGLSDFQLNNPANKFIIVVKKEKTNLQDLIALFEENPLMRSKRVLVCDDEADFASRAYYQRKGEMNLLRMAEYIETFIKLPEYIRYMQITATPYSLYLQPDGTVQLRGGEEASPWLPRYTAIVPIHGRYIGGKQYYVDSKDENSMYSCLFTPVNPICLDILSARNEFYLKSLSHSDNLDSLNYAIVCYMFAAAIRTIQKRKTSNERYFSSCLIHCEIAKKNHAWQEELITGIITDIKNAFLQKSNTDLHILDLESDAYESFRESNRLGNEQGLINEDFPTFAEVEAEVKRILEYNDYIINVVNSEEAGKVATMLNEKGQLRLEQSLNFFIGGSILDRGITIDNMLCFFYGRDPKKFQMDTVLQHARMYGARDKEDMACTRFFTTEAIYDVLDKMNEFDECMFDYLIKHKDSVQTDDFVSMVIGYDKRIKPSAQNKYTPANTKVLKPHQRILPVGFQTGDAAEIEAVVAEIDEIINNDANYKKITDDEPFFLMSREKAVDIIKKISTTYRYGEEFENVGFEWDDNEMITPIDHCTFDTDGDIYVLVRKDRNMSRERSDSSKRTRWIDAPDDGRNDTAPSRNIAEDRPVLMLLRQNGSRQQGWKDTAFYWPVLVLPKCIQAGIFTINDKKKFRAARKQIKLDTLKNYPKDKVLQLTIGRDFLFKIICGIKDVEYRDIKRTTASLYLKKDEFGEPILVEGTDPNKYYNLSSVNDFVFPFEIRDYDYLYLRASNDFSGSQAIVRLKSDEKFTMSCEPFEQQDYVHDEYGGGENISTLNAGLWTIQYNLADVLEYKIAQQDEESFELFKQILEEDTDNML